MELTASIIMYKETLIQSMKDEAHSLHNTENSNKLLDLIDVAEKTVGPDGTIYVSPKIKGIYQQVQARTYWLSLGVAESDVDVLLDRDSKWIYSVPYESFISALHDPTDVTSEFLYNVYEPLYKPVQPMLNDSGLYKGVFNDHTLERHIARLQTISGYIRMPKRTRANLNALAIAIKGHDTGAAEHRPSHAYQAEITHLLFLGQEIFANSVLSEIVLAIRHHDERVVVPMIKDLRETIEKAEDISPEEKSELFLQAYSEWFTVLDSLVRLIDKLDNGRSRMPNLDLKDAVHNDDHISCNSVFYMNGRNLEQHLRYEEDRFIYSLHLLLTPDEEHFIDRGSSATYIKEDNNEERIVVAKSMKDAFHKLGVSYFETSTENFGKLYHERMLLIVLDTFNSNPDINEVVIEFVDPTNGFTITNGEYVSIKPLKLAFHRTTVFDEMSLLEKIGKGDMTMKELSFTLNNPEKNSKE